MNVIFYVVLGFIGYASMFLLRQEKTFLRVNIGFICSILTLSSVMVYGCTKFEETRDIPLGSFLSLLIGPLLLLLTLEKQKYKAYYFCFSFILLSLLLGSLYGNYFFSDRFEQFEKTALKINMVSCIGFGSYGYLNYINHKKETKYQEAAVLFYVVLLFLAVFFFSTILLNQTPSFLGGNLLFLLFNLGILLLAFLFECTMFFALDQQKLKANKLKWKYFQETNVIFEKSISNPRGKVRKKVPAKISTGDPLALNPTETKQLLYAKIIDTELFLDNSLTLNKVSELTQLDKNKLNDYFRNSESLSFKQYINRLKVEYAINIIREREKSITVEELTFVCGFNTRLSFYRAFVYFYGFAPSELLND